METTKIKVPNWKLHEYSELYKITKYRDGCVWKMELLGIIKNSEHPEIVDNQNTLICILRGFRIVSLSTDLYKLSDVELDVITKLDPRDLEEVKNGEGA